MLTMISDQLHGWATGRRVLLLFLATALMAGYVMPAAARILARAAGQSVLPLDLMFFFKPGQALEMMERYGPEGRILHARIQLTADLLYPITYSLFLALLLSWLFQRGFPRSHSIQKWNLLPGGALVSDLLENTGIVVMLNLHPAVPAVVAWATMIFGTLKWSFILAAVGLVAAGILRAARNRFRSPEAETARV